MPASWARAMVRINSTATWLAAANPTVQPESRITERTAGWRGWNRHRSWIPEPRMYGTRAIAMAATPAVVPSPSR